MAPKKNFAADFRAEKSQEGLRIKTNDRRCPVNLGPRILKIVVFGSNANVYYFFICCVTSEPEMEMRVKVKESSASSKNNNF